LADDWVRTEIERGLDRGIRVIPVLVRGAKIPQVESLPSSIAGLSTLEVQRIDAKSWDEDVSRLIRVLKDYGFEVDAPKASGTEVLVHSSGNQQDIVYVHARAVGTEKVCVEDIVVMFSGGTRLSLGVPSEPKTLDPVNSEYVDLGTFHHEKIMDVLGSIIGMQVLRRGMEPQALPQESVDQILDSAVKAIRT